MSIIKAINRALKVSIERNEPLIYWAVDLHGVVFRSNYEQGAYAFTTPKAVETLKLISGVPDYRLIIWSSCHPEEYPAIISFLAQHGIKVDYFNENPEIANTPSGNFERKFYFSILLDDKAGFDPETDWDEIFNLLTKTG
jgi:hypothetical protein